MITVEPITENLGAEVKGVLDTRVSREEIVATLRDALVEHHLLVVRARPIGPKEQVAFATIFGTPEIYKKPQMPEHPEIYRVANRPELGHVNIGQYWHVDGTMREGGVPITIWHVVQNPEEGGDTLFQNMQRAYDELPADLKAIADGLTMVNTSGPQHSVVKRHPATGRKSLYINMELTRNFSGLSPEESKAINARFAQHLDREGGHYRHKWRTGDILVGDNFSCAHKATPADPRSPRVLHRATIKAGTAFFGIWKARTPVPV